MSNVTAGVSRVCITPPLGTPLSGNFEPRYASGVHDDLFVTAFTSPQEISITRAAMRIAALL